MPPYSELMVLTGENSGLIIIKTQQGFEFEPCSNRCSYEWAATDVQQVDCIAVDSTGLEI